MGIGCLFSCKCIVNLRGNGMMAGQLVCATSMLSRYKSPPAFLDDLPSDEVGPLRLDQYPDLFDAHVP